MITALFDPTSPEREEMYLRDMLGEAVLKVVEEPGFDNVARLADAQIRTRALIGLPDYPFSVGVDWDATLNRGGYGYKDHRQPCHIGPHDILFFKVGDPPRKIRDVVRDATSRQLHDGLPVLTTHVDVDGIAYEFECFAHSEQMSAEKDMAVLLRMTATNPGKTTKTFRAEMWAAPAKKKHIRSFAGTMAGGQSRTRFLHILYVNGRKPRLKELPKGDAEPFFAPYDITVSVTSVRERVFATAKAECLEFWETFIAQGMTVHTPEKRINDAYRAWQCYAPMNCRKVNFNGKSVICEPHEGSGFYGAPFGIQACNYVQSLLLTGHFARAKKYIQGFLHYLDKDGLFIQNFGGCDHGCLLVCLGSYYLQSDDLAGFRRFLPKIRKAIGWIRKHRELSPEVKGTLVYGLIRPIKYAADIKQADVCYLTDVFLWAGMTAVAAAYEKAGMDREAAELKKEAGLYRKDIVASMKQAIYPENELFEPKEHVEESMAWENRAICQRGELNILPLDPMTRFLNKRWLGGYYYALLASEMMETDFFDGHEDLLHTLMTYMERRGGVLLGNIQWYHHAGLDHAYSYGYLYQKMRQGKVPQALLGFYSMLAYGMSRDTFSGGECVPIDSGGVGNYGVAVGDDYTAGVPQYRRPGGSHKQPMTYCTAQQTRTLRMLMVREQDGELLLGAATPRPWFRDLEVKQARTEWGSVSFSVRLDGDHAVAVYSREPIRGEHPKAVVLHFRHPDKRAIAGVTLNGKPWKRFNAESVRLPGRTSTTSIEVAFE